MARFDATTSAGLFRSLENGQVAPGIWRQCVEAALEGGSREDASALVAALAGGYQELATNENLETSPELQARLASLEAVYIERAAGQDGDPKTMDAVFDELRRRFFSARLGRAAARFVGELLGVVDLEHGRYGGRPVDPALIDDIAARGDETLLRRFADRLPSGGLRERARRNLIHLEIAASPFPEVHAHAAEVEDRVLRQGANRVSLDQQPVEHASLDTGRLPAASVVVRQDITRQTAVLVSDAEAGHASVLPALQLRGALWVDVPGLSRPITICQSARRLDPTPCIAPDDVTIDNRLAIRDREGIFRFRDRVGEADAALASDGQKWFPLPIAVRGRPLVSFGWPLRFEAHGNLVLVGSVDGGPDLKVLVTRRASSFSFVVMSDGPTYRAVLEEADLGKFHIVSRGAAGRSGASGMDGGDGSRGMDGTAASCPMFAASDGTRGGDGNRGGDGEDGGGGGDGGNIEVDLLCEAACAPDDIDRLGRVVISEGGPGGSGGSGGRGGRGGSGGWGGRGDTCTDPETGESRSLSGGSGGLTGTDGPSGSNGRSGSPGRPGRVRVEIVPRQAAGRAARPG